MENIEKQMIYDSAMDLKEMFDRPMEELKEQLQFFGLPNIPNAFTTYTNKANDMIHLFDTKGVSLFDKSEDGEISTYNPCFQAFDYDMMTRLFSASNSMMFIFSILKERYDEIYKNRLLALLKGIWEIINKRPAFLKPDVLTHIHGLLTKIKDIDKGIYGYNVHKDLYSSIVSYVKVNYEYDDWADAIERGFVPTLEQLGFDDTIAKLRNTFGEPTSSYAERIEELKSYKEILQGEAREIAARQNDEQPIEPEEKIPHQ